MYTYETSRSRTNPYFGTLEFKIEVVVTWLRIYGLTIS